MSVLFHELEPLLLKLQLLRAELDEQGARTPSGIPKPRQACSQVCLAFAAASFSQAHVGPDVPHLQVLEAKSGTCFSHVKWFEIKGLPQKPHQEASTRPQKTDVWRSLLLWGSVTCRNWLDPYLPSPGQWQQIRGLESALVGVFTAQTVHGHRGVSLFCRDNVMDDSAPSRPHPPLLAPSTFPPLSPAHASRAQAKHLWETRRTCVSTGRFIFSFTFIQEVPGPWFLDRSAERPCPLGCSLQFMWLLFAKKVLKSS